METVTLQGEDLRRLHNAVCALRDIAEQMETTMVKIDKVQRVIEDMESALSDAYDQDHCLFNRKMDYYSRHQRENRYQSVWSIYDLPLYGFLKTHPFHRDARVTYQGHSCPIGGDLWADVYRAADTVILQSGDDHHIFIEGLYPERDDSLSLRLTTGS